MTNDLPSFLIPLCCQFPVAGAGIYIAKMFLAKSDEANQKLITTFEAEIKNCESRYQMVFNELMRLKELIK